MWTINHYTYARPANVYEYQLNQMELEKNPASC